MKLTWRRRRRSEVEESELSGVVLGFFRGFARNGRVKGEAINGNRGLEARVVIGSIFHGGVPWQAPTLLVAQLLHLRLVHFFLIYYLLFSLSKLLINSSEFRVEFLSFKPSSCHACNATRVFYFVLSNSKIFFSFSVTGNLL